MLMPSVKPLDQLENACEFIARHIGISDADEQHMLGVIGEASRRALIESIVPRSIARAQAMDLPAPVTEAAALAELKAENAKNLTGIDKIRALDDTFDEQRFEEGVKSAYRYFYDRWNAADEEGLDALCGPQLLAELSLTLDNLAKRGLSQTVTVHDVTDVEIKSARVTGRTAVIEVLIHARQSETQGTPGETTEGTAHTAQSRWVLARALGSDDPNWELQSMRPAGAQA